jgi:hypothetical protein
MRLDKDDNGVIEKEVRINIGFIYAVGYIVYAYIYSICMRCTCVIS